MGGAGIYVETPRRGGRGRKREKLPESGGSILDGVPPPSKPYRRFWDPVLESLLISISLVFSSRLGVPVGVPFLSSVREEEAEVVEGQALGELLLAEDVVREL